MLAADKLSTDEVLQDNLALGLLDLSSACSGILNRPFSTPPRRSSSDTFSDAPSVIVLEGTSIRTKCHRRLTWTPVEDLNAFRRVLCLHPIEKEVASTESEGQILEDSKAKVDLMVIYTVFANVQTTTTRKLPPTS